MAYHGVGTSSYALARHAGISQGTAHRYIGLRAGEYTPSEETLRRFAHAFDVPLPDLRELAHRPRGEASSFRDLIPAKFDQLSRPQRAMLLEMGWFFLRDEERPTTPRATKQPRAYATAS